MIIFKKQNKCRWLQGRFLSFVGVILSLTILCRPLRAQYADDVQLFTIMLNDDTTSLFGCGKDAQIGSMLAGPVVMDDGSFLFYSPKGYALYNRSGRLKDSHSVIKKNKRLAKKGKPPLHCGFPVDNNTILYYQKTAANGGSSVLLSKKIGRRWIKKINEKSQLAGLTDIGQTVLFNLSANALTYEMSRKAYLQPFLVGYTAMEGGTRWWSLDRFYSFTSPLIAEKEGKYVSFFPGLTKNPAENIKKNLVEPLGVCLLGNTFHYYGVYTPTETKDEYSYQRLFLCDQAGNLLYDQRILKRTLTDEVIGENEAEKMQYTVRAPRRYVFFPSVDRKGNIYYGILDFQNKQIEVMQRPLKIYHSRPSGNEHADLLTRQQGFVYRWDPVDCVRGKTVRHLPLFRFSEVGGEQEVLTEKELQVEGYLARIVREENSSLKATINRSRRQLPDYVQRMQDSLSGHFGAWCPNAIELLHESRTLRHFNYPMGSMVIAARVVAVTEDKRMFVRVDLAERAEMLVFTTEGDFLNRFTFNKEPFDVRADVIAIAADGTIAEKDYEQKNGGYRFRGWTNGLRGK